MYLHNVLSATQSQTLGDAVFPSFPVTILGPRLREDIEANQKKI